MAQNDFTKIIKALDNEDADLKPTDTQVAEALEQVKELQAQALDAEDLELSDTLDPAMERLTQEHDARVKAAEEKATKIAEKREKYGLSKVEAEAETDAEDKADETDGDDAEDKSTDGADAEETVTEPKAIAAATIVDNIKAAIAKRPAPEVVEVREPDVSVQAIGPANRFESDIESLSDAAQVFNRFAGQVGRRDKKSLIRMDMNFPTARQLGQSAQENTRLINEVTSPRAITASGGICDPLEADFSHPVCGDRGRPIRDGLTRFQASRGGVRYIGALSIDPAAPGVTTWTVATDEAPGTATKACPAVDCETEIECEVDAIVACLTIGNFQARFSPETWQAALEKVMIEHDRVAEQKMLAEVDAASTAVTYAGGNGSATDVLVALVKASAGIRSRLRETAGSLVAILPDWVREAIVVDLITKNGGVTADPAAYSLASSQVAAFFTSKNIRPIWSPDAEVFGAQGAGPLLDFPGGDAVVRLFPEGSFLALDGGTLDLGTEITDSTLNATNDRQAFMETFEKVCFRGCESLAITVPVDEICGCGEAAS